MKNNEKLRFKTYKIVILVIISKREKTIRKKRACTRVKISI